MDLKKTTKNTHRTPTERSEVDSRPKGVNESRHSRSTLNQRLQRIHSRTNSTGMVLQELIRDQWETNFQPHWFITIEWNDLPTSYAQVEGHARHLRNVLLTQLMGCRSPKDLPDPPGRPSAVFFHERSPAICRNRLILPFHTHLHLGELPSPLNHQCYLQFLLTQKVAPRVQKLLKTTTKNNEGVVVKPWSHDHHGFYNLKDYYKYKHHQDPDLVLDYRNSDLRFTK